MSNEWKEKPEALPRSTGEKQPRLSSNEEKSDVSAVPFNRCFHNEKGVQRHMLQHVLLSSYIARLFILLYRQQACHVAEEIKNRALGELLSLNDWIPVCLF